MIAAIQFYSTFVNRSNQGDMRTYNREAVLRPNSKDNADQRQLSCSALVNILMHAAFHEI